MTHKKNDQDNFEVALNGLLIFCIVASVIWCFVQAGV